MIVLELGPSVNENFTNFLTEFVATRRVTLFKEDRFESVGFEKIKLGIVMFGQEPDPGPFAFV